LNNKLLVIGMGAGQIYRGLVKCELGNAPLYDTITSKTILLDLTGTTLLQGSDGYLYICRLTQGTIVRLVHDLTGISNNNIPVDFSLSQNYPNPFNPVTSIKYEMPQNGFVTLKIFNVLGMEISSLVNQTKRQGTHEVTWNASDFPSGVYFYELNVDGFSERKKMILVK
ncbi:MAG TPA: T9SS type A sorting domain-containing protein, partial [Saprospiraceae bacterium]|nr:T9SS type A sorting domain-containing protein [Saprospiraceae bacterium]